MENKIHDYDVQLEPTGSKTWTLSPICQVIKVTSYIVCLSLFTLTSFSIFQSYLDHTTIKSAKIVKSPNDILELPILLLCNSSAYKEQALPTSMVSYKNNTMKMKDVLVQAYHIANTTTGLFNYRPSPIMDDVNEIATIFHGSCIILNQRLQLKANEIIWLELVSDFDLDLYVIDHEDEVFAPSFIWPKNPRRLLDYPAKHRLGKTLSYIQLQLTKQSNKQYSKPCNSTIGYVYGECVKEKLRLFLEEPQNNIFTKCFAPFMSNVTYGLIDGYESLPSCNEYDATTQSLTIANFFFAAALYGLEECKEPCEVFSYKMEATEYDSSSIVAAKINDRFRQMINITSPNKTKNTFSAAIAFLKTEIDLTEEIKLYTVFDFISSVGGNLGLFTGFSVLAVLLTFVEWLHTIMIK